jgi:hypothetical protein
MRQKLALVLLAVLLLLPALGLAAEEKVEYTLHIPGYFESNKSGLKGPASYLLFTKKKGFDDVFKSVFVPGGKAKLLPKDAFDTKIVLATIKRGSESFSYKVEKVTAKNGVLELRYTATGKGGGGSATFASPLIVAVPRGKWTAVEFIENGKKVATIKMGK